MKTLKIVSILSVTVIIVCCFAVVSFGFNPQPEPPAESHETQTVTPKLMKPLARPAQMDGSIGKPGEAKMEEEEELFQRKTKMIDPGDDGYMPARKTKMIEPGNDKVTTPGSGKMLMKKN